MYIPKENVAVDFDVSAEIKADIANSVTPDKDHYRRALARQIVDDVDKYAIAAYDDGHRSHLGASIIGEACTRKIWLLFRWIKAPKFSGRMQRLFNRGHREEDRYEEYLKGIGATIYMADPASGRQFRVSACNGHFGGSLDAIIKLPERYGAISQEFILGEFKTKATGGGFNKLTTNGVMLYDPRHYDQICVYGAAYQLRYALYMSTNKNDDDLHAEIVPVDTRRAVSLHEKATFIIGEQTPPRRIAENPTYTACKYCEFNGICFSNHLPEKNCRSCRHAKPVDEGKWFCTGWNAIIPPTTIAAGCDQWASII